MKLELPPIHNLKPANVGVRLLVGLIDHIGLASPVSQLGTPLLLTVNIWSCVPIANLLNTFVALQYSISPVAYVVKFVPPLLIGTVFNETVPPLSVNGVVNEYCVSVSKA